MIVDPLLTEYLFMAQKPLAMNNLLPQVRGLTIYYGWKVNAANANVLQPARSSIQLQESCTKESLNCLPSWSTHTDYTFYTVFHIFLMVLIKSVIKLNYIPAHQWNFYIFLELLTATYPLSLNTHCRWSPRPLLKDSRCGSCTLGWGRCILLSFHSGSIPHMPNLYRWDPLTLNAEIFLFDETQNLNDKFVFFLVMC